MRMPMTAPTIVPDVDTVPARRPNQAATTLTRTADGSASIMAGAEAFTACELIKLASHRTAAAAAGTDTLSSSLTGMVSTNAATTAAASGASTSNASDGSGTTAGRVQQARAIAPPAPQTMNATVPAIVFSWF